MSDPYPERGYQTDPLNRGATPDNSRSGRIRQFWVVTEPTAASTLPDICFRATLRELRLQILGGLDVEHVDLLVVPMKGHGVGERHDRERHGRRRGHGRLELLDELVLGQAAPDLLVGHDDRSALADVLVAPGVVGVPVRVHQEHASPFTYYIVCGIDAFKQRIAGTNRDLPGTDW